MLIQGVWVFFFIYSYILLLNEFSSWTLMSFPHKMSSWFPFLTSLFFRPSSNYFTSLKWSKEIIRRLHLCMTISREESQHQLHHHVLLRARDETYKFSSWSSSYLVSDDREGSVLFLACFSPYSSFFFKQDTFLPLWLPSLWKQP